MPFHVRLICRKDSAFRITFFHCHPVLCQRTRFIRTDHIDRSQRFHRRKFSDNRIYLHHPGYAQGENNSHDRRKPLRHSRHRQRNSRQQHITHIPFLHDRHKEKKYTDKNRQGAQHFPKIRQPFLKRCYFLLCLADHPGNMTDLGLHAYSNHNSFPSSIGHVRGHISHIPAIPDIRLALRHIVRILIHRYGLSRKCRLFNFQTHRFGKAQIRRNLASRFQTDDIPRH